MKPSHHRIIPNWLLLICAIVLIIALGYLVWFYCVKKDETANTVPTATTNTNVNSNTNSAATADWKTYTNSTYGFSFKYPKDWKLDDDKSDNTISLFDTNKSYGTDFAVQAPIQIDYKQDKYNGSVDEYISTVWRLTSVKKTPTIVDKKNAYLLQGETGWLQDGEGILVFSEDNVFTLSNFEKQLKNQDPTGTIEQTFKKILSTFQFTK